ncbi:MAG TPA: T9SS type A sorting domain-containing protein, partial [Chitinophagales bacterium]|nr:T9SS type A sorting domain-containing protein [Chitinophagales bacterium]HRK29375.1 T9SS type A sorting domain-containing protein [Chitinophagales bacterium]
TPNGAITLNVTGGIACSGGAYYTYTWSPLVADATQTSGNGTHTYSGLPGGAYSVTITDCGGNSIVRTFTITDTNRGFKTIEPADIGFSAAPNPTEGLTTLTLTMPKAEWVQVALYAIDGKEVMVLFDGAAEENETLQFSLDMTHLPAGTYFAVLNRVEGETKQLRLMLMR